MKELILAAAMAATSLPALADRNLHLEWFVPTDGSFWAQTYQVYPGIGPPITRSQRGIWLSAWADAVIPDGGDGRFFMSSLKLYAHGTDALFLQPNCSSGFVAPPGPLCYVTLANGIVDSFWVRVGSEQFFIQPAVGEGLTEWDSWYGTPIYKVVPDVIPTAVPEPETFVLLGLGFAALWARRRKKTGLPRP